MPREIKTQNDAASLVQGNNANNFKDRLVKLIPSEIVTAYITIQGLVSGAGGSGKSDVLLSIVILVLTILTPIYLRYISDVRKIGQLLFTTVAFLVWVIAIGSPLKEILNYPATFIGSILLVLYTLIIPFVYKG